MIEIKTSKINLESFIESDIDYKNDRKIKSDIDRFKNLEKKSMSDIITEFEIQRRKTIKLWISIKSILFMGFLLLFAVNVGILGYNFIILYIEASSYDLCILILGSIILAICIVYIIVIDLRYMIIRLKILESLDTN